MRWFTWVGLGSSLIWGVGCGTSDGSAAAAGAASSAGTAGQSGESSTAGNSHGGMTGSVAGSGGASGGKDGAEPSAANICADYAAAICDFTLRCNPIYFYQSLGTMDGCKTSYVAECLDRLVAPGAQLKPADLPACAQAMATTSCALPRPAACRFRGTLADGSRCAYGAQCSGGLCKLADWFDTCGVCSQPAGAGESCHQRSGCKDGLQCSFARATSETCVPVLAQGEACDPMMGGCADNFSCQNNTCQPQPHVGDPCDAINGGCDQTQNSECIAGVCQQIAWHVEGESCEPGIGVVCRAGFDCEPTNGPGICHAVTLPAQMFAADCQ